MTDTTKNTITPREDESLKQEGEDGQDYTLVGEGCWITVKGFSIRIKKTDEGVSCTIYQKGREMDDFVTETYAFDNELEDEEPNETQS